MDSHPGYSPLDTIISEITISCKAGGSNLRSPRPGQSTTPQAQQCARSRCFSRTQRLFHREAFACEAVCHRKLFLHLRLLLANGCTPCAGVIGPDYDPYYYYPHPNFKLRRCLENRTRQPAQGMSRIRVPNRLCLDHNFPWGTPLTTAM